MIGLKPLLSNFTTAPQTTGDTSAATAAAVPDAAEVKLASPLGVNLSSTGISLSASKSQPNKNADIDNSDLPDSVKETLKRIREIRAELEKKLQELQDIMADQSLTPEQRKVRAQGLQSQIASLSGALTNASSILLKQMSDEKLNPDQKMTAGSLMMA